ncbi:MAG: hypothetical protein ISS47_08095 [Candidatus Omnitrophica bacterium]|nr:hypothetical protein [Candidatus Omnitrophota bacterium]
MAIVCEKCKRQYDITLFQFGRTLKCDCGYVINPNKFFMQKYNKDNAKRKNHKKTKEYIKIVKGKKTNA